MKIAVIGGGISGLATAFYLKRFSSSNNVTLYEAENQLGGKLKTVEKFGFSIELTNHVFSEKDIFINELINDIGLSKHIIKTSENSKIKYFFDNGILQTIPTSKKELFKTKSIGIFAKLSAFADFARPKKKAETDESLQSFLNRRLGKSTATIFGDLLATSFFASSADKLSVKAAFTWLDIAEQTKGKILADIFDELTKLDTLLTFKDGSSAFIADFSSTFSFEKKLNTEVSKVKKIGSKWSVEANGECSEFDKVVLCTPSFVSSRLLKDEDETLCELLKNIEYSPLAVVSLAYDDLPHNMNGFGIVNSKRSNAKSLGIVWDSSIDSGCAPEGKKLIRVIVGGQREPFLPLKQENELIDIATGAISDMMGVYEEPMLNHITRWHKAIPNYEVGHKELVGQILDRARKLGGLYINSSALEGISLDACAKNSKQTALKIISE